MAGVLAFLFSEEPFVCNVATGPGINDGGGGLNVVVAGREGSSEHTCGYNREKDPVQLVVIAFPFQWASTSLYNRALLRSSTSSPRGIRFFAF